MTRARLTQLKNALEDMSWIITADNEKNDLFEVENERIIWNIYNERNGNERVLTFVLCAPLGGRTNKLADIFYVNDNQKNLTLFFDKINSVEWTKSLKQFIWDLN